MRYVAGIKTPTMKRYKGFFSVALAEPLPKNPRSEAPGVERRSQPGIGPTSKKQNKQYSLQ